MYDSCRGDNEAGVSLQEEAASFAGLSVAETVCWACGEALSEGDSVVVYVCRPAGSVRYEVGRVLCDADAEWVRTEFTLGVRELLIESRVGTCSDAARQASWLVLIDPSPVVVSAASSSSASAVGGTSRDADTENTEPVERRDGPTPLLAAVREYTRANGGDE